MYGASVWIKYGSKRVILRKDMSFLGVNDVP